jgi:hypothetical protein
MANDLLQAIAVTAELCGTQLSEPAARVFLVDLSKYPIQQVLGALVRCRRELKGRLTLADVISRLDDGRPGPEEAWAAVAKLDEGSTIVWTYEMQQAHAKCEAVMDDRVAARMAFLERYRYLCQFARDSSIPVQWIVSPGHDAGGREAAIVEAVELGRIAPDRVQQYLPFNVSQDVLARVLCSRISPDA